MYSFKNLPRLVPWTNWEEWTQVYKALYSSEVNEMEFGLKRVCAWRSRGKVPVAIETTANFIQVKVKELKEEFPYQQISELEKRMIYSLAIIRFVNGLVDAGQTSTYAQSVSVIANRMKLPPSLVEIRHEATHNQLPSIYSLRSATSLALEWLKNNYWTKQKESLEEEKSLVIEFLNEYKKSQKQLLKVEGQSPSKQLKDKVDTSISKLKDYVSPNSVKDTLIPLLLTGNYLIPTKNVEFKVFESLPAKLRETWLPALKKFQSFWSHFIPTLIYNCIELAHENTTETTLETKSKVISLLQYRTSLLVCWSVYLLKYVGQIEVDLSMQNLIQFCFNKFHPAISPIIDQICKALPLETANSFKILHSLKLRIWSLLHPNPLFSSSSQKKRKQLKEDYVTQRSYQFSSLETLEEKVQLLKQEILKIEERKEKVESSKWTFCDNEFLQSNLGLKVNGELPILDLPLEIDQIQGLKRIRNIEEEEELNPRKKVRTEFVNTEFNDENIEKIQKNIKLLIPFQK